MNKEKFALWLEDFFAEKIQNFIDKNSWTVLIMDNCACYLVQPTFQLLLGKKNVIAFFPANSMHWASPLDVSCKQPFKQRLSSSLKNFRTLKAGNLASWIEPAHKQTFRPDLIQRSFLATQIWDNNPNGSNINWTPSQYEQIIDDMPSDMQKASSIARRSKALSIGGDMLDKYFLITKEKIEGSDKVIAGPRFVKTAMAGKVVSELILEMEKRSENSNLRRKGFNVKRKNGL